MTFAREQMMCAFARQKLSQDSLVRPLSCREDTCKREPKKAAFCKRNASRASCASVLSASIHSLCGATVVDDLVDYGLMELKKMKYDHIRATSKSFRPKNLSNTCLGAPAWKDEQLQRAIYGLSAQAQIASKCSSSTRHKLQRPRD